jgi:hypothetical protein
MFRFNHHNQGAYYLSFAKVIGIKINYDYVGAVLM